MYFLRCLVNSWYDGMEFDSLAAAYAKQKQLTGLDIAVDIFRHEDRETTVCVKGSPLYIPVVNRKTHRYMAGMR